MTCKLGSSRQIRTNRHNNNNKRREEEKELRTSRYYPDHVYTSRLDVCGEAWTSRQHSCLSSLSFLRAIAVWKKRKKKRKKTLARARSSSFSYFGYAQRRVYIFIIWLFLVVVWKRWARVRPPLNLFFPFISQRQISRATSAWSFGTHVMRISTKNKKKEQDAPPHNKI